MYAVIAVFNLLSVCGWSRYTAEFAAPAMDVDVDWGRGHRVSTPLHLGL
jgi:hypothetical protein